MFCPKCGHEVGDYVSICPNCGELLENNTPSQQPPSNGQEYPVNRTAPGEIPDYKVQSILLIVFSAILCCVFCFPILALPFAIVALVSSNKVEAHVLAGNNELARKASEDTKKWCWVSFGILLASIIISIVLSIVFINSEFYRGFMDEFLRQYEYYYNLY